MIVTRDSLIKDMCLPQRYAVRNVILGSKLEDEDPLPLPEEVEALLDASATIAGLGLDEALKQRAIDAANAVEPPSVAAMRRGWGLWGVPSRTCPICGELTRRGVVMGLAGVSDIEWHICAGDTPHLFEYWNDCMNGGGLCWVEHEGASFAHQGLLVCSISNARGRTCSLHAAPNEDFGNVFYLVVEEEENDANVYLTPFLDEARARNLFMAFVEGFSRLDEFYWPAGTECEVLFALDSAREPLRMMSKSALISD